MCLMYILLLQSVSFTDSSILRCRQEVPVETPRFYFAGACVRSKMSLIGASYASSLEQCSQYALWRRGLAINYLDKKLLHPSAWNYSRETCLVYECPEFDVQLSLEIDSLYDYYSIYARPMPSTNVTCLPSLGVFQVHHERLNYTDAEDICESEDGYLADISTGPRSVQIGAILLKEHVKLAYIGMAQDEGKFITPSGMPSECLPYRAWAPGQPRKEQKCAALTDKGLWVSFNCKKPLPFVCELKPSGPLRPCVNLPKEWRRECRQIFVRSFPNSKRRPRCGDPSIDENTFRLPLLQSENKTTNGEAQHTNNNGRNNTTIKPVRKIPN